MWSVSDTDAGRVQEVWTVDAPSVRELVPASSACRQIVYIAPLLQPEFEAERAGSLF